MADPRDRLTRAATGVADVVSGRALGRQLAGGVKFPTLAKPRRQVTVLAGTPRPRRRGAGGYAKGAGRPD